MNYEKNKRYFNPRKKTIGIILAVLGALTLLVGISNIRYGGASQIIFGLLLAGAGYAYIRFFAKATTGAELDAAVAQKVNSANIKQRALRKLGLDEDDVELVEPIVCDGYYFKNIRSQSWYGYGSDNILRSSNYQVSYLIATENQMHFYSYMFSLIADEDSEMTDQYFYSDVVSISTASDMVRINAGVKKGREETANYECFKLTTAGGTSVSMSIRNMGDPDLEKKIKAMKKLLIAKKTQG